MLLTDCMYYFKAAMIWCWSLKTYFVLHVRIVHMKTCCEMELHLSFGFNAMNMNCLSK